MKRLIKEQNIGHSTISEKVWQDGLIVFDTNVLLNLYRYNEEARDELLELMKSFQERLWMPYQIGLEFLANRESVIKWLHRGFIELVAQVDECKKAFFKFYDGNYAKHRHIDRNGLDKLFDKQLQPIKDKLNEWKKTLPDYGKKDVIKNKILALYDNRVGDDYNYDELLDIYAKGRIRYDHKIPPGYKDDTKDKREMGARHVFGDLIAWLQTMDYANEHDKDIIFVCEDLKEDWWEKDDGKINKPRKELLDEFKYRTGRNIVFHTQKGFVEASKKKIKETTMNEIERVRTENERIIANLRQFNERMASIVPQLDFSAYGKYQIPTFDEIQKLAMNRNLENIEKLQERLKTIQNQTEVYDSISKRVQEMTGWGQMPDKSKK